jgi:hypothetical protein
MAAIKNKDILVTIFILIFIRFYSYEKCMTTWYAYSIEFPALIILIINFILNFRKSYKSLHFTNFVLILTLLPVISSISCKYYRGQSFFDSLNAAHMVFGLFFYFFLHKINYGKNKLENIVVMIAVIYMIIYIIQQYTYPVYAFYSRGDSYDDMGFYHQIEVRGGFYRFFMMGDQFSILSSFIMFERIVKRFTVKRFILLIISLFGIYLTGSRQYISLTLIIIALFTFYNIKKSSSKIKIILFVCVISVFSFYFISSSIQQTNEQLRTYKYDSRTMSISYFMNDFPSPVTYFIGNGIAFKNSAYGKRLDELAMDYNILESDVGILGLFHERGAIYIFCIFLFYWKFNKRYYNKLPTNLKMFFLYLVLNVMVMPIARLDQTIIVSIFLYLCDKNIYRYDYNIK